MILMEYFYGDFLWAGIEAKLKSLLLISIQVFVNMIHWSYKDKSGVH